VSDRAQIVGDEKVCEVLFATQLLEQVHDLSLNRNVERRNRLICNNEIRIDCKRAGDADALSLTTGKFVRISFDKSLTKTNCLEQFLHALLCFPSSRQAKRFERLANNLANRHAWIKRCVRILKDYLEMASLFAQLSLRQECEILIAIEHAAVSRFDQTQDRACQR
jgi:hypothetical protein